MLLLPPASLRQILPIVSVFALAAACAPHKALDSSLTSDSETLSRGDMSRSLIVSRLADPDILKVSDDLFYLVGTGSNPGAKIPVYESVDLNTFAHKVDYIPSSIDKAFDYCDLWAPDISLKDGEYLLYFSATRVSEGQACGKGGAKPATYLAKSKAKDLAFGVPEPLRLEEKGPRTVVNPGCPSDGCSNAIRIDAETAGDWFFYVWFDKGNNISSFRMSDPGRVIHNTGPANFKIESDEEKINEAASIFKRGSQYYMFFSTGFFNSQYAMQYVMADSMEKLTRSQGIRRFSRAVRNSSGKLVENHGHNTVVEHKGEFYNFYHQGHFNAEGKMTGRSTYKQRLQFHKDGTLAAFNLVQLNWNKIPNATYSLDVITRSGEKIGPCLGASVLGKSNSVSFNDICLSAGDRIVPKNDIKAFRLYWSDDGQWGKHSKEVMYDGVSDAVSFQL